MRQYSGRSRASSHLPGSGASIRLALATDGGQPCVQRVNYVHLCPHSGTALKMNEGRPEGDIRDLIEHDLFMTDTQVLPPTLLYVMQEDTRAMRLWWECRSNSDRRTREQLTFFSLITEVRSCCISCTLLCFLC